MITRELLCYVIECMEGDGFPDSLLSVQGCKGEIKVAMSGEGQKKVILKFGLVCVGNESWIYLCENEG